MYYNREGNKISREQFCDYLDDPEYGIIQQDHVGQLLVSTVWLGVDHGFMGEDPVIFETMVFGADMNTLEQCRYATIEEARRGHQSFLDLARKGMISSKQNGEPECGY